MRIALVWAREKLGARVKERATKACDLFLHAGLTGRTNAGIQLPRGSPGLPRLATDGGMDAAIRGDERD